MTFRMGDSKSENYIDIEISQKEVIDIMGDYAYEKLTNQNCSCEPKGETNVIDCNCEDEYSDYYLSEVY